MLQFNKHWLCSGVTSSAIINYVYTSWMIINIFSSNHSVSFRRFSVNLYMGNVTCIMQAIEENVAVFACGHDGLL